jgi:hypothetical protein
MPHKSRHNHKGVEEVVGVETVVAVVVNEVVAVVEMVVGVGDVIVEVAEHQKNLRTVIIPYLNGKLCLPSSTNVSEKNVMNVTVDGVYSQYTVILGPG